MKYRDPVVTLLLVLLVPFYIIYWFYDTAQGIRQRNVQMPSNLFLFAPYLMIFGGWLIFLLSSLFLAASGNEGSSSAVIGGLTFLSVFLAYIGGWILLILYYYHFSKGVVQVIGYDMSPGIYTLIMVFIPAIPVYLMQQKINAIVQWEYYNQPQTPAPTPPAEPEA